MKKKLISIREEGGKAEILKNYTKDCEKVIFVENSGKDIDEVYKALPFIKTYFMNRVPNEAMIFGNDDFIKMRYEESRKIAERKVVFEHIRCHSFDEVIL